MPTLKGRGKYITSAEHMAELFEGYKKWVFDNPFLVHDFVGKDGKSVERKKQRPYSIEGFKVHIYRKLGLGDIQKYLNNFEGQYGEYVTILQQIRCEIRENQISGGMVGVYSSGLTARLNGLADNVNTAVTAEVKILNIDPLG